MEIILIVPLLTGALLLKLGLISGGAAIGGNIISSLMANRRDRKMWDLQNQYNDPKAQMARLKKAGLNPALVYGSSSVVGNTTAQRPQTQVPDIASNIPNLPQLYATAASVENKQANTLLQEQNAKLAEENAMLAEEKKATELSRQMNLDRSSENIFVDTQMKRGLYPYNKEIKEIQAKKIFPMLVQKYGLENANLAWKVVEQNPQLLEGLKISNAEKQEQVTKLLYENKVAAPLSNYLQNPNANWLLKLLIGTLYENGKGINQDSLNYLNRKK